MNEIGLHALVGLIAAGGFLCVFYGPWQSVCTDFARQVVFEKRDAIFDLAHKGGLSFDSREYRTIRDALNEILRFAHDLSAPRLLFVGLVAWVRGDLSQRFPIDHAIDNIRNPAARAAVGELVRSAIRALVVAMAVRSLFVILLFPATILALIFFAICRNAARGAVRLTGRIIQVEIAGSPSGRRHAAAT